MSRNRIKNVWLGFCQAVTIGLIGVILVTHWGPAIQRGIFGAPVQAAQLPFAQAEQEARP